MSINLLKGFEFRMKDTFIHSLDPRTKLLVTIIYTIFSLSFARIVPLVFFLVTLVPTILIGRITRRWLASMKGLTFIIFFILILNTLLTSLDFAISMCMRILLLVTSFSIFFMTVHPDDLALALLAMKVPFKFTFTLTLATRFMPTLALEAQTIIDAQRSRGLEFEKGSIITRIKNMIPIIIPLIINSIKRAFSVAEALESKAFGAMKQRTNYFGIKMRKRDYAVVASILAFFIIYVTLHVLGLLPVFFSFAIPY
ncbi:MAG: energy-coupling factor transporter transmembrane component T family protein [Promethearchaeota archaeon]